MATDIVDAKVKETMPSEGTELNVKSSQAATTAEQQYCQSVNAPMADTKFTILGLFRFTGAGIMAAVAFLDPGNLEADIVAGTTTKYSLLWWYAVCILVFGFTFQALSGKLGLVTGKDLAYQIGVQYPTSGRILLWILLELSIIAADIQETVGCALAVQVLSKGSIPLWAGCLLVSVAAFGLLQLDRLGFRYLEAVYACLICLEAIALAMACFSLNTPAKQVMHGFVPNFPPGTIVVAAGALGALVMPYNTFFQSHVINGRNRYADTDHRKRVCIQYMKVETMVMLAFAFVINVCAVVLFASFYGKPEAQDLGLESAGYLLYNTYGQTVQTMWAVGLLASGLVATICLTYAGQVIMVGLLQIKVQATSRLLATRLISLLPCVTLAVVFEATHTFDKVAQVINIVQSLCLPFGLIPLTQMTSEGLVMGAEFANKGWVNVGVTSIVVAVVSVNMYTLVSLMLETATSPAVHFGFACVITMYLALVTYFAFGPSTWQARLRCWYSRGRTLFMWLKTNRRWADIESMLEVHF